MDLAELRADALRPEELAGLSRFPSLVDAPVILSFRRARDGGRWTGQEADRRRLLRQALGAASGAGAGAGPPGRSFACLELEHDLADPALEQAARARGCRLIRSYHDPRGVPADLAARLRRLAARCGPGGDLPKAAVLVRGSRDQLRLARAFRDLRGVEKVLLGEGEYGVFSRILAGRLGSALAYCAPAAETPTGPGSPPGQGPDARTLAGLYAFRAIGPDTALYGVVGRPIAHSRSPHLHNPALAALGLDAVYVPFLADRFPSFLRAAELLGVRGLSVTVPFKERALRLAAGAEPEARAAGAANTLLAGGGRGGWRAANTDVEGFLAPLGRAAPELVAPAGAPGAGAAPGPWAAVLGAGGAARAVVLALSRLGLRVLVLNRTPARARALARRFGCAWGFLDARELARLPGGGPALLVQATTVGLEGDGDPLPGYRFQGTELVYELLYGPAPTPFLARARAAGCRTLDGLDMLRAQAAAQLRLFTGREPPGG